MHGQCTYRAGGDLECREGFLDVLTPQYNTDAQAQFQCPIQCRDKGGVMNGNWTNAPNLPANSVCGCTLMNRMDTFIPAGNDLSIIPRTRWEDCKLSCAANNNCRGVTWNGGTCWLKTVTNVASGEGWLAAVKD